jgi:hypothetical protein
MNGVVYFARSVANFLYGRMDTKTRRAARTSERGDERPDVPPSDE